MRNRYKLLTLISVAVLALALTGCGSNQSQQQPSRSNNTNTTKVTTASSPNSSSLSGLNYRSGSTAYVNVNHGRSTLNPRSWNYDHVNYTNLDHENRTSSGNTGYLDKKNVANDSLRTRQIVKPTGYHQKFVNNQAIINRGHEIAYSLSKGISKSGKYNPRAESGDQNNPKNLFTQTAFSNQEVQTIFESKVRNALKNNEKVVYQVKPIFQGNDLMAKGVQMQAVSTNHKLNFNVYLYNVQPGMKFNYATGHSTVDRQMKVPTPAGAPKFHDNNQFSNQARRYGRRGYNRTRYYGRRAGRFARHYAEYRVAHHFLRHGYYRYRRYRPSFRRYHSLYRHRF